MPKRTELRSIPGDKHGKTTLSGNGQSPSHADQLRERMVRYRRFLLSDLGGEAANLLDDMEAAIEALRRLETSSEPDARLRVVEYQVLIAELEAEFITALRRS